MEHVHKQQIIVVLHPYLHSACMYGKSEIEKTLLQHQANIDTQGVTPLHIACVSNRLEVVKELLKHKPDIDPIRTGRLTPLMIAADRGNHGGTTETWR